MIFPYEKIDREKSIRIEPYKLIFPIDNELRKDTVRFLEEVNSVLMNNNVPSMCNKYCLSKDLCEEGI